MNLAGNVMYTMTEMSDISVRPEEEEVGEEDSMELQRLARREKNRPVNV
jgi:hypothetical protein